MNLRHLKPLLYSLIAAFGLACSAAAQTADPPGRVARVNLNEGPVSVEPAGSDTWTEDVRNRPLSTGDRLWADRSARAEIHIGSSALRIGSETGISMLAVDDGTVRIKLSAGSLQLRVRELGPEQTFEVATPTASVALLTPGSYRLDVNETGDDLRVVARNGEVAVTDASGATTVRAGQEMRFHGSVADGQRSSIAGSDGFDRWADDRDRNEDRSESARYVSREITGYEDLDSYGRWQESPDYGPIWIPAVAAGWTPYRDGHWVWVAPWGWTWIDDAPWGFAPCHYGRWVRFAGAWAWAPGPRQRFPYYAPALVAWVGPGGGIGVGISAAPVGWFPLGWNEVYVPTYTTSRVYIQNINITNIHVRTVEVDEFVDRSRREGRPRRPDEYRNFGVGNAVVSTTREAFASGQPVRSHPAALGDLRRAGSQIDLAGPTIRPTAASYGRPAAIAPRADVFARPALSTQGGVNGPNRDAVRPITAPPAGAFHPATEVRPTTAPEYRPAPAVRPEVSRSTPEYRPQPTPERNYNAPRPAPDYRPQPAPERQYEAPRPAPEYRPQPAPERQYEAPRPAPEYRPQAAPESRPTPPPPAKSAPPSKNEDRRERPKDR